MFETYNIGFVRPGWLWLLAGLPILWYFSYYALAGLGWLRRFGAIGLRTLILLLFVVSAAEIQIVKSSDRLTTIFLLDQSLSIPEQYRRMMVDYVNDCIQKHHAKNDRVGVIVFGKSAGIEIPPFDDKIKIITPLESDVDPRYTDLSAAIKLAMGSFPEDAAKRVVIVSDGNQNRGEVLEQAKVAIDAGVGIDVLPVEYGHKNEILVERLAIPPEIRKGQPVDLRVTVTNTSNKPVTGRLDIRQTVEGQTVPLANRTGLVLEPGRNFLKITTQIDEPSFYTFDAEFTPDVAADDKMAENNRATAYADVAGAARVLLIEDQNAVGQHDRLAQALRLENIEVSVRPTSQLFTSMADLQPYDAVILGNTPREAYSQDQIEILVKNTEQFGAGLIMLGGPNSFGAGGWSNTLLEEAMPLDFHIKNAKVVPKGALVLLMHASEMANGNHWQKVVAKSSIQVLGSQDYCGMLHWNGTDQWMWAQGRGGLDLVGPNRARMLGKIDTMTPGDMPQFDPAMVLAHRSLVRITDAAVKHMIIISDGDPSPPSALVLNALANANPKITVTTVAIGAHGAIEQQVMRNIAKVTGGKFYEAKNPKTLPKIYQEETRRVTRPLIHENAAGFTPAVKYQTPVITGVTGFPPITGYVMTTKKDSNLVEVALISPEPGGPEGDEKYNTILAHWQYGLGKTVCFTTDAGATWANQWTGWQNYNKFFSQMVRFAMRPTGQTGKFTVATETKDGRTKVVVTALDEKDEFKNFLTMEGTVMGPDRKGLPVKLEQTGPGRYEGAFASEDAGGYFMMISPGTDPNGKMYAPLRTGINIAYSAEFREQEANRGLLVSLAGSTPLGGKNKGQVYASENNTIQELLAFNPFRHDLPKATSSQDIWQWMIILAAMLFFLDVFNRRVTVRFDWLPPLVAQAWAKVRGKQAPTAPSEYMERLRSRKAEATSQFETQKAAMRFEPKAEETATYADAVGDVSSPTGKAPPAENRPAGSQSGGMNVGKKEEESYTDRLLKAKKKVWDERKPPPT